MIITLHGIQEYMKESHRKKKVPRNKILELKTLEKSPNF